MAEDANPELENFRKQWKEEVTTRSQGVSSRADSTDAGQLGTKKSESVTEQPSKAAAPASWSFTKLHKDEQALDGLRSQSYHDLENKDDARSLSKEGAGVHPESHKLQEPSSALEHYEKAVEREIEGKLGDSLKLYRKAFRVHTHYPSLHI